MFKLYWRLGFKWTITRNSIITSYISLTNLRRKVGIWFPPGWKVEQLWWTELPFKQWFPIDLPSGSESVRRMCSVRIMWHQSFCFNHNTCRAVTHTAPPRASRHQLPKQRQLFPPISDKSARSQQARHSLKMQEWTFPIIHKVLPCQHLQKILKQKGMAGFH